MALPLRRLTCLGQHILARPVSAIGAGGEPADLEDVAAVRKVLETYSMAVWTADAEMLKTTYHEQATFNGSIGKRGVLTKPEAQFDDLAKRASNGESFKAQGVPYSFRETVSINVYGNIAIAVTQEDGAAITPDKPFTCIDVFQMIKVKGQWKIISQFFSFGKKMAELEDIAAVRKVMEQYTEGTWTADEAMLRGIFHENAVMNGYFGRKVILGSPKPFFEEMAKLASVNQSFKSENLPYRSELVSMNVYAQAAAAIVQETGYAGAYSFTDSFLLIKIDGHWKILSKLFTGAKQA